MKKTLISILILIATSSVFWCSYKSLQKPISLFEVVGEKNTNLVKSKIAETNDFEKNISTQIESSKNFTRYENKKFGFSFYYLPQLRPNEYEEGNDTLTLVVENQEMNSGFQIFVVPYKNKKITEERFTKDVTSGVRYNIKSITITSKNIPAVTFNSYDKLLGNTREIWFIYNNSLYEITAPDRLDDLLAQVILSWQFI